MSPKSVQRFWGNDMHKTRAESTSAEADRAQRAFGIELVE